MYIYTYIYILVPVVNLRRSDKLYNVIFMGEHSQDAGGPYRESFAIYAAELQSTSLPLLLQTPNGRHAVGINREKWILHPGSTQRTHMEMFTFLGKLFGIAIRAKEYLALHIPSIIWKLLVNDVPTLEDLEAIDLSLVKSINSIRHIEQEGIYNNEQFSQIFFETFTTTTSDDRIINLLPDGANIDVTYDNREEYCDLVLKYRLHEFDTQAAAIRRGMASIVPVGLLVSLFSLLFSYFFVLLFFFVLFLLLIETTVYILLLAIFVIPIMYSFFILNMIIIAFFICICSRCSLGISWK